MIRLKHPLVLWILIAAGGVLFIISPVGRYLEEEYTLALMFNLRGQVQPPPGTIVVNIDHASSAQLGLPERFSNWPRSVYAELIQKINALGAAVIVFDVHFGEKKTASEDQALARVIRQAGNVILFEKLVREKVVTSSTGTDTRTIEAEKQIPPIDILNNVALAVAPFPIPKIPVRINQAWTFKDSAGETPTLPVTAFQAFALKQYDTLYRLLTEITPEHAGNLPATAVQITREHRLVETMRTLRGIFQDKGVVRQFDAALDASPSPPPRDYRLLKALSKMYSGENNIYINYYGSPATIPSFSFHEIFTADQTDTGQLGSHIKDSVVFVGAARTTWSEQKDGFFTVFTQPDGLDLSGVEVLATVYTNLFQDRPIRPLPAAYTALALLATATIVWSVSYLLSPVAALIALSMFITAVGSAAYYLFSHHGIWVPVITLLLILPVGSFAISMLIKYLHSRAEQRHIRKALQLYLPDNVVEEISKDLSFIESGDRMVYGVCLLSDAQNYTTLSETLPPSELSGLIKEYFACLFKPINNRDGLVCNVIGDAMFALWPSTEPDRELNLKACQAALQIPPAIKEFNINHPGKTLPTRIGLHAGYLIMGNIGAEGHFEYAPVGDVVNTASRIEGLNKQLGTWVLASEETLQDLDSVTTRGVGTFLLSGKSKPVTVHELISGKELTPHLHQLYTELFPEALDLFRKQRWEEVLKTVQHCLTLQPDDGPSLYYQALCTSYIQSPPAENLEGVISLTK